MHIKRRHMGMGPGGWAKNPKAKCDICTKMVSAAYLERHKKLRHAEIEPIPYTGPQSYREAGWEFAELTVRYDKDGSLWVKLSPKEFMNLLGVESA